MAGVAEARRRDGVGLLPHHDSRGKRCRHFSSRSPWRVRCGPRHWERSFGSWAGTIFFVWTLRFRKKRRPWKKLEVTPFCPEANSNSHHSPPPRPRHQAPMLRRCAQRRRQRRRRERAGRHRRLGGGGCRDRRRRRPWKACRKKRRRDCRFRWPTFVY